MRIAWGISLLIVTSGFRAGGAPEVVFHSGNIHTLDPGRPRAEAIAVKSGHIAAVGGNREILDLCGPETMRVDLAGATVVPGLQDAHGHMAGLGSLLAGRLDLRGTRSFEELLAAVRERAAKAKPGEWILGGRWDQANWGQAEFPTHERLSAVTPDNPVWLTRIDGHAGLANRNAMEQSGVTRDTPDPPGGEILRGKDGEPTGMFIDNAEGLIHGTVPESERKSVAECILAAQSRCLAAGLTCVHDAGISWEELETYRKLADEGKLKIRIYAMVYTNARELERREPLVGYGDGRLTARAVKCMIDGAMGSRGAWLLEPYSDRPEDGEGKPYTGLPVASPESIREISRVALKRGFQVCTHAIGDRGIREVLSAYEEELRATPVRDHRFRIEHAQNPAVADLPRFAALGVIPSMQPTHATSDMRWAEARVGSERIRGAYAWASLLRSGSRIAAGSDFPVESENPLWGIYAAVTRQDHEGRPPGGWRPEERMTREEALRAFTIDAAFAAFEEDRAGTITVGKRADFTVLSKDILRCPPEEILKTECVMTVIGGEVVFRR